MDFGASGETATVLAMIWRTRGSRRGRRDLPRATAPRQGAAGSRTCRSPRSRDEGPADAIGRPRGLRVLAARAGAGSCRSRVGPLDLGMVAQVDDEFALRFLHDVMGDLVLHLIERRQLALANLFDLDDVPAERALHRVGDLAGLQLEGGIGEFRHHLVFGEPAEIAALGTRILRQFVGDLAEVFAVLHAGERGLGLLLGRHQNMAGMDLGLRRMRLGGIVVDLLHRRVGRRVLGDLAEQILHQDLVVVIGHFAGEIGVAFELVGRGLLGDELQIDEVVQDIGLDAPRRRAVRAASARDRRWRSRHRRR